LPWRLKPFAISTCGIREPPTDSTRASGSQNSKASGQQWTVDVITGLCPVVFNTAFPVRTQIVETQAVFFQNNLTKEV